MAEDFSQDPLYLSNTLNYLSAVSLVDPMMQVSHSPRSSIMDCKSENVKQLIHLLFYSMEDLLRELSTLFWLRRTSIALTFVMAIFISIDVFCWIPEQGRPLQLGST